MDIYNLLIQKDIKPKRKSELLIQSVAENFISIRDLQEFSFTAKDSHKATCIEVAEYISKSEPSKIDAEFVVYAINQLKSKSARVVWESSKLIGNIAKYYPELSESAVPALLENTGHKGTVVRWSTAYALCEILKLGMQINRSLTLALNFVWAREEKESIRKMYHKALYEVQQKQKNAITVQ